jgi:RNase H
MTQTNPLQITWPQLQLPSVNSFINTTELISSANTNFPFQLLYNNQHITFIHHNKYQEISIYEIYQLAEPQEGQTNLMESIDLLPNSKSINLPYKQIKFKNLKYFLLQIDFREILAIIDIANNLKLSPILPPCQPQINILSREIHLIQHIVESSYYQNQLIQLHNNILDLNLTNLQFATDASIQNLQTTNIRTSIGWICENNSSIKFNAAITPFPDSSRSELIAIIPLLLVIPINSIITILTDSSIAIKTLLNFPTSKLIQAKNWDIISIINSIKSTKNILINLIKVKSHSTNSLHNQADLLAKQGSAKPLLTFSYTYFNLPTYFSWNNHIIIFKARSFIKNIITIQELISWSSLKFFSNFTSDINWNLTFKLLNLLEYNSHKYSFYIKILTNNLPTMQNLNIRYPNLYTTNKCCKCPLIEDSLHILLCSKNTENI